MKVITFPKNEWQDIKERFKNGKEVYTLRVSDERGKYLIEDVLMTEWEQKVKVVSIKQISGGIEELKKEYEYFGELTEEMLNELREYNDIEIIELSSLGL